MPEDVAASDDNRDLNAETVDVFELGRDSKHDVRINAEALITHQGFATELQQNTFELQRRCFIAHKVYSPPSACCTSAARSVDRFSNPSPVLNRAKRRTWMFSPILPTRLLMSSLTVRLGSFTNAWSYRHAI